MTDRFFFSLRRGVVKLTAKSRMNENPPKPARHRIGQKILLGLAGMVLLLFLAVLVLDMIGKNSLTRYERQWEDKGEHFDFASFIPKPVPDDQNFALTPIVATSYESLLDKHGHRVVPFNPNVVPRLWMEIYDYAALPYNPTNDGSWGKGTKTDLKVFQLYYRELATKTNEFPNAPQMQSPAADVLLALSKFDPTIEELRQAAALPDSRFPLNYDTEEPMTILLPHLAALKRCSQVLQLRAVAELQNGQPAMALADVKLMLRLIDSVHTEPILISHMVRISMLKLTLQPVWEGLQDHKWSDAQLAELDQELAKLDFLADYEFSLRGERAVLMAEIEHLRHTRHFEFYLGHSEAPNAAEIALHILPNSVFYRTELLIAREHQELILPIVDVGRHSVSPGAAQLATTNLFHERSRPALNEMLPNLMLDVSELFLPHPIEPNAKRFAYGQSVVDMARVACALERFRLAQGEYPETLDALQPRFIESLPHDVIGGQPLKYRRMDNGQFTLYSVGWNGTDDGGAVVQATNPDYGNESDKGDWVWPGQVISNQ